MTARTCQYQSMYTEVIQRYTTARKDVSINQPESDVIQRHDCSKLSVWISVNLTLFRETWQFEPVSINQRIPEVIQRDITARSCQYQSTYTWRYSEGHGCTNMTTSISVNLSYSERHDCTKMSASISLNLTLFRETWLLEAVIINQCITDVIQRDMTARRCQY